METAGERRAELFRGHVFTRLGDWAPRVAMTSKVLREARNSELCMKPPDRTGSCTLGLRASLLGGTSLHFWFAAEALCLCQ